MRPPVRLLAAVAALVIPLAAAPAAGAAAPKHKAKASLVRAAGAVKLEVKVTSARAFTTATRPRSVKVTGGGKTYRLKRAAKTRRSMTFRSSAYTGAPAQALEALAGSKTTVKIKTRAGTRTVRPTLKAPSGAAPAPAPGGGAPPPVPAPGEAQLTRNDDAGRQAMNQVLRLEWASFGASGSTAEYRRLFIDPDGSFRFNRIDWNSVSGESCSQVIVGTWTLKEGYTTDAGGGGTVVKLTITPNDGQAPFDALLGFPNAEPNNVYEGPKLENRYERNDQIAQNC